jgi:hypothetical protein
MIGIKGDPMQAKRKSLQQLLSHNFWKNAPVPNGGAAVCWMGLGAPNKNHNQVFHLEIG